MTRDRVIAWMGRRYPFYSGCGRLAQSLLLRRMAGHGEVWTRLRNGCRICVPLSDFDGRAIHLFGDVDPKVTWLCRSLLHPGAVAVDIGANLGVVTLTMAKCVGPTGLVVAFEPSPLIADYLQRSIEANADLPIVLHRAAVGDCNGPLTMHIPNGHSGKGSIVRQQQPDQSAIEVRVVRASDALRNVARVRLVKMDVEGYEPEVLRGMAALFSNHPPHYVLFECHADPLQTAAHESVRILEEHDYEVNWITRSVGRPRVRPLAEGITRKRSGDLLAVHRSMKGDRALRTLR